MSHKLDPNQRQLVSDLAADYSDRIVSGEDASIGDYLEKLPDDECRKAFRSLANMSRFIAAIEVIEGDGIGIGSIIQPLETRGSI
jgi:hypothetical protein